MGKFVFREKETGEELVFEGSIKDAERFEKDNPNYEWMPGKPLIHSGRGMSKPDDTFRDLLRDVKKKNYKSEGIETF